MTHVSFPKIADTTVEQLLTCVQHLYTSSLKTLVFHGWPHVKFVHDKALDFAVDRQADAPIVRIAALVHDLNYYVDPSSSVTAGQRLRSQMLSDVGLPCSVIDLVESIVVEASIARRGRQVSTEVACLSDADTLYKALPVTPVLLAHRYMRETGLTLSQLAHKIVSEQAPKLEEGFYFYDDDLTSRYGGWAKANLELWRAIDEAVDDPAVRDLVGAEAPEMRLWPS